MEFENAINILILGKEGLAIRIYTILARELDEFIEEYKVDVRKCRGWDELDAEAKAYWYRTANRFLESYTELPRESNN